MRVERWIHKPVGESRRESLHGQDECIFKSIQLKRIRPNEREEIGRRKDSDRQLLTASRAGRDAARPLFSGRAPSDRRDMYSESLVESLVVSVYQGATAVSGWSDFFTALARALDSGFPSVHFADTSSREGDVAISSGMEERMLRAYTDYDHEHNVWFEWYADFRNPKHWAQGLAATILQTGAIAWNIGVFGDARHRAYNKGDIALQGAHASCAAWVQNMLG